VSSTDNSQDRPPIPSRQDYYRRATELGFAAAGNQAEGQFRWLGAEPAGGCWRLPVLNDSFDVDLAENRVKTSAGVDVSAPWRILALHYLTISSRPERHAAEIVFADLPESRSYAGVYQGRVISRLCATAGRDADRLRQAAEAIGGRPAEGGDAAFDFDPFPRLSLRLVWHAPDEEFPSSATLLLPANIESYFCAEDVVVLSECLVARLGGRPF